MPYSFEKWMAGRWIAGPGMEDALEKARQINRRGISVIVNYLGEEFTRKLDIEEAVETYLRLITEMSRDRIHGDVSVKPTQIGLSVSQELMRSNYMRIMEHAKMNGIFVWLDMEEPSTVQRAIDVYLDVGRHVRGGICIQAYLKRSLDDAKAITRKNGTVRLVKGAYTYREGSGMIRKRDEVSWNYFEIMRYLFEQFRRLHHSNPRQGHHRRGAGAEQEAPEGGHLRDAERDRQPVRQDAGLIGREDRALPAVRGQMGWLFIQEAQGDGAHKADPELAFQEPRDIILSCVYYIGTLLVY